MSGRSARRLYCLMACLLSSSLGCWEQWSNDWFPQMKWQPAVQPFERTMHEGRVDPFLPAEGTVPVGAPGAPPLSPTDEAAQSAVPNPRPRSLESLENGRRQYEIFCATCHGSAGLGDGAVSMMGEIQGPFAGVLALAGPGSITKVRSDGHLYGTIRYGRRRMPAYRRIPDADRWDIVNYIRYLNGEREVAR